jgi:hypothetical protein
MSKEVPSPLIRLFAQASIILSIWTIIEGNIFTVNAQTFNHGISFLGTCASSSLVIQMPSVRTVTV